MAKSVATPRKAPVTKARTKTTTTKTTTAKTGRAAAGAAARKLLSHLNGDPVAPKAPKSAALKSAAKAKPVHEAPVIYTNAEFRENGGELLKDQHDTGKPFSVSTSRTVPHLRFRRASDHPDEVEALEAMWAGAPKTDFQKGFTKGKKEMMQLRSLAMVDFKFLMTSGRAVSLVDRHPDCPHGVIDAFLARAELNRRKDLDQKSYRLLLRTSKRARRIETKVDDIAKIRASALKVQHDPSELPRLIKLIERFALREGVAANIADLGRKGEDDLDRY